MPGDWWKMGQNRWYGAEPWNARNGRRKITFYPETTRDSLRQGGGKGDEDKYTISEFLPGAKWVAS